MKRVTINIPLNSTNLDATEVSKTLLNNTSISLNRFRVKNNSYRDTLPSVFIVETELLEEENVIVESIFRDINPDYVLVAESEDGTYTLHLNSSKGIQHSDCEIEKFYYLLD